MSTIIYSNCSSRLNRALVCMIRSHGEGRREVFEEKPKDEAPCERSEQKFLRPRPLDYLENAFQNISCSHFLQPFLAAISCSHFLQPFLAAISCNRFERFKALGKTFQISLKCISEYFLQSLSCNPLECFTIFRLALATFD